MSTAKKPANTEKASDSQDINKNKTNRAAEENPVKAAHDEAEADIDKDPDMQLPTPNDDLDEGELANLGGDKNDLV